MTSPNPTADAPAPGTDASQERRQRFFRFVAPGARMLAFVLLTLAISVQHTLLTDQPLPISLLPTLAVVWAYAGSVIA
ncbi:MAG: hypothetical protein AAF648_07595 [Pseudomonadota bacterium]